MKCYHGTTLKNFVNLLNGGDKPEGIWNCSYMDDCFYVYPMNKIIKTECLEDEEDSYIRERCIQNALESGLITAAFQMETQDVIVIEMDIPEEELEDDYSCDNMSDIASFTGHFDKNWIIGLHSTKFSAMYAPFFVPDATNRNLGYVDDDLLSMAKIVQNSGDSSVFCDLLDKITANITERNLKDFSG